MGEPYKDHVLMAARDYGASKRMTGKIELFLVMVNDSTSIWTESEKTSFFHSTWDVIGKLHKQAEEWSAVLDLSVAYFEVTVPVEHEKRWYEYIMEEFFCQENHDMDDLQSYYENRRGSDDTPILFIFNKEGRSNCSQADRGYRYVNEYAVYYAKSMGKNPSVTHELLHLYGAMDYYYPDIAAEAAKKYFPDSSMLVGGDKVDDLTAYLIGWTYHLTDTAKAFLDETACITRDMVSDALHEIWRKEEENN